MQKTPKFCEVYGTHSGSAENPGQEMLDGSADKFTSL